jgi:hypothetical protein
MIVLLGKSIPGLKLFSYSDLNTSLHALLVFKVSIEKSVILMGLPLYVICFFSLAAFNIQIVKISIFLELWKLFCYYLIEYIAYPFGLHLFSFSAHDSQVWSFDGVTEFLHILFTALEFD